MSLSLYYPVVSFFKYLENNVALLECVKFQATEAVW